MEYPLRPPLFSLSLCSASSGGNGKDIFEWYNELRYMEAEVRMRILFISDNNEDMVNTKNAVVAPFWN